MCPAEDRDGLAPVTVGLVRAVTEVPRQHPEEEGLLEPALPPERAPGKASGGLEGWPSLASSLWRWMDATQRQALTQLADLSGTFRTCSHRQAHTWLLSRKFKLMRGSFIANLSSCVAVSPAMSCVHVGVPLMCAGAVLATICKSCTSAVRWRCTCDHM